MHHHATQRDVPDWYDGDSDCEGIKLSQGKMTNEAAEMRKAGVKPCMKNHYNHLFRRVADEHLRTEEGKTQQSTHWQNMTERYDRQKARWAECVATGIAIHPNCYSMRFNDKWAHLQKKGEGTGSKQKQAAWLSAQGNHQMQAAQLGGDVSDEYSSQYGCVTTTLE